ncbi:hypothetical protein STEG23_020512, partial [Scotinomys teguina]
EAKVSHEYQQNMAYQVATRLRPPNMTNRVPKASKRVGDIPCSPTRGPSCTTVTYTEGLGQFHAGSSVDSDSVSPFDHRSVTCLVFDFPSNVEGRKCALYFRIHRELQLKDYLQSQKKF